MGEFDLFAQPAQGRVCERFVWILVSRIDFDFIRQGKEKGWGERFRNTYTITVFAQAVIKKQGWNGTPGRGGSEGV